MLAIIDCNVWTITLTYAWLSFSNFLLWKYQTVLANLSSILMSPYIKLLDYELAYDAVIKWVKMSNKEMEFDGHDVVPNENHNLRIIMANLRLRDDCQREEQFESAEQSVGKWTIKSSKTFFETVKKMCNSSVLSLKKYVAALLSHMKIYRITMCPHDKFS